MKNKLTAILLCTMILSLCASFTPPTAKAATPKHCTVQTSGAPDIGSQPCVFASVNSPQANVSIAMMSIQAAVPDSYCVTQSIACPAPTQCVTTNNLTATVVPYADTSPGRSVSSIINVATKFTAGKNAFASNISQHYGMSLTVSTNTRIAGFIQKE